MVITGHCVGGNKVEGLNIKSVLCRLAMKLVVYNLIFLLPVSKLLPIRQMNPWLTSQSFNHETVIGAAHMPPVKYVVTMVLLPYPKQALHEMRKYPAIAGTMGRLVYLESVHQWESSSPGDNIFGNFHAMLTLCPLCSESSSTKIFELALGPILPVAASHSVARADLLAPLEVVECTRCRHWYNRAFDAALSGRMYAHVLTNRPVDISMFKSLDGIAEWIGESSYSARSVIEVGGGTGHFARILGKQAKKVTVFEPSSGLTKEALPEDNISLVNEPFEWRAGMERADLVVCRQVLEHVSDPVKLLSHMREALSEGGRLYVEVPRTEFIVERDVVVEFHNAHVSYFFESQFVAAIARVGLSVDRMWRLKDGHDMGFLLERSDPSKENCVAASSPRNFVAARFKEKVALDQERISALQGRIGIYGANWQGASFYNLYDFHGKATGVIDDNGDYDGARVVGRFGEVPVTAPLSKSDLQFDTIVVTAHLHFDVIVQKLRKRGFKGEVFNVLDLSSVSRGD